MIKSEVSLSFRAKCMYMKSEAFEQCIVHVYNNVLYMFITSIAKKPYIFVIFEGGGGPDPLYPIWIRTWHSSFLASSDCCRLLITLSIKGSWQSTKKHEKLPSMQRIKPRKLIITFSVNKQLQF